MCRRRRAQAAWGGRVGVPVAGNEVDDLEGLLAFSRDRAAQLRDLGGAVEPDPGRCQRDLDGAAGAPAVVRAHRGHGGMRAQGSFLSCRYRAGMLPLTVIT
jgi:hypothetical protein